MLHRAASDRGLPISTVEAKTLLDHRVQPIEVVAEHAVIDRPHDYVRRAGRRRHRPAEGRAE